MSTKEAFHKLIDGIADETKLKSMFNLVKKAISMREGELWKDLSDDEKNEILLAVEEEDEIASQVSHEELKSRHSQWLLK